MFELNIHCSLSSLRVPIDVTMVLSYGGMYLYVLNCDIKMLLGVLIVVHT